jgi:hypothetical protein
MRGGPDGFAAGTSFGSGEGAGACEGALTKSRETITWRTDQNDAVAPVAANIKTPAMAQARRARRGRERTKALRWPDVGPASDAAASSATPLMRLTSAASPGTLLRSDSKSRAADRTSAHGVHLSVCESRRARSSAVSSPLCSRSSRSSGCTST